MTDDIIEKQIVERLISIAQKFPWIKSHIHIEGYNADSISYQIILLDKDNNGIKYGLNGFDSEEEAKLTELIQNLVAKNGESKWNKATFEIAPDGSYKSDYEWDAAKEVEDYYWGVEASFNWIYDRLAEYIARVQTQNFKKQEKAIIEAQFEVYKKDNFFYINGYAVFEDERLDNLIYEPVPAPKKKNEDKRRVSSEYIQELLHRLYQDANEGVLKERWQRGKWNYIRFNITAYPMKFHQDLHFEWKPELE